MHRAVLTQEHEIKVMPGYLYHMGVLACDPVESGSRHRTKGERRKH